MALSKSYYPKVQTTLGMLPQYPSWGHAVLELIDNSGEYRNNKGAGNINISLTKQKNGKIRLILADDGKGVEELGKMFAFDHEASDRSAGDTGKFGFGFKGSSQFLIGRHLIDSKEHNKVFVVTKVNKKMTMGYPQPNDDWQFPIYQQEQMDADQQQAVTELWDEYAPDVNSDSGTIICCDTNHDYSDKDIKDFKDLIAVTYHDNFKDRINITVNGATVEYKDIRGMPLSQSTLPDFEDFDRLLDYVHNGKKTKVNVSARMHPKGSGAGNSGFCVYRNGRLVVRGGKFGFSKVLGMQASMRGFQIVLEVDDTADDLLMLEASKLVHVNQSIDKGFKEVLEKCGLKALINKVHDSSRKEVQIEEDLSHWRHSLQKIAQSLRAVKGDLQFDNIYSERIKQNQKRLSIETKKRAEKNKTGISNSKGLQCKSGLENFNGDINFSLEPLCEDGEHYTYEFISKRNRYGPMQQLLISFNSDVDFIRLLLAEQTTGKGRNGDTIKPTASAISYLRDVVSTILATTDGTLTDEELAQKREIDRKLGTHRPKFQFQSEKYRSKRSNSCLEHHNDSDPLYEGDQAVMDLPGLNMSAKDRVKEFLSSL
jgi:anti-sigma regulatory factor (Ser/Thr protein kinase)